MKSDSPLWHAKHVVRAVLLLLSIVILLVVARTLLVPESWGVAGWFRLDNVKEHMARPLTHGGDKSCAECHEDAFKEKASAAHVFVSCELCHDALAVHVSDGEMIAEMPVRRNNTLCLNCHSALLARPADFPQINVRDHLEEQGGEMSDDACFDCHNAHVPL